MYQIVLNYIGRKNKLRKQKRKKSNCVLQLKNIINCNTRSITIHPFIKTTTLREAITVNIMYKEAKDQ